MKVKPAGTPGGVVVELGPGESEMPGTVTSPFRLKRILVPIDFSDCSKKALQYALPLAGQFKSELTLVHVVHGYTMSATELPDLQTRNLREAAEGLEALQRGLPAGLVSRVEVREGNPALEIVEVAGEQEIDLIVISTHGRSSLAHILLGSVAERVVRHAACPVLVVREQEREFAPPIPIATPSTP